MYFDKETNLFKGEVLVSYFKPESVGLALSLLNGKDFRPSLHKDHIPCNINVEEVLFFVVNRFVILVY
jgi:hypothetical protein